MEYLYEYAMVKGFMTDASYPYVPKESGECRYNQNDVVGYVKSFTVLNSVDEMKETVA